MEVMQTITVPDVVAETLKPLSSEQIKKHVITENGMTIAVEEEILRILKEGDFSEAMTPEQFMDYLKSMHNDH